jgi:sec-independent protein translocase protein TatC
VKKREEFHPTPIYVKFKELFGGNLNVEISRQEVFQSLARFRKSFLQIILFFMFAAIPILFFSKAILRHLRDTSLKIDFVAFSIPESFLAALKLSLYTSLFLSMPFIFFHLWRAFTPLFHRKGLKSSPSVLVTAIFLFYLGAFFCYFITLPFGVQFLLGYQSAHLRIRPNL